MESLTNDSRSSAEWLLRQGRFEEACQICQTALRFEPGPLDLRDAAPIFSTALLCRHLESAYGVMSRRAAAGLAPEQSALGDADAGT
jgi:hypothetical protein